MSREVQKTPRSLKVFIFITKPNFHNYLVPLGYAYVSSTLKEAGYDVRIHNSSTDEDAFTKSIQQALQEFSPDLVITGTSYRFHNNCPSPTVNSALEICHQAKNLVPSCKTLLIGPLNPVLGNDLIETPSVDALALGEPETICLSVCQILVSGEPLDKVAGLLLKVNGQTQQNLNAEYPDLTTLPLPDRDSIGLENYISDTYFAKRATDILMSRGCPINCTFCFGARDSKRNQFNTGSYYRKTPPEKVVEEIDILYHKWGVRGIKFVDIEFCISKEHVTQICNLLISRGYRDLYWRAVTRVTSMDRDLLALMYQAGCRSIYYGVESGDPEILKTMGKKINLEQIKKTFHNTWENGIKPEASFLLGVYGETEETIERTIQFACELNPVFAVFHVFMPYPGILMEKHFDTLPQVDLDSWDVYQLNVKNSYCEVPPERLLQLSKEAYKRFYLRPTYLLRMLTQLDKNMLSFIFSALKGANEGGIIRKLLLSNKLHGPNNDPKMGSTVKQCS